MKNFTLIVPEGHTKSANRVFHSKPSPMTIPDDTFFSENPWNNGNMTFAEARKVTDNKQKIELVQNRLLVFYVNQIKPLANLKKKANGKYEIWSPFPLAYLTLLGIETLGRVISDVQKIENDFGRDAPKEFSKHIYTSIDPKLSGTPTKPFKQAVQKHLGKPNEKIERYSDILHKYMRNTYTHGFQGLLVSLNHEQKRWGEKDGRIILNPYWFWQEFERVFDDTFKEMLGDINGTKSKNAVQYFDELIK